MKFPADNNAEARLAALARYHIMDTAPEAAYDNITRVAAEVCETPIALITLLDESRQWFKSRVGIQESQTPREVAFCAYAIQGSETMIVEDASKDERFAGNPLVTGAPEIRYYMGAPLTTSDGIALGTLCVIDNKPRQLSAYQQAILESLRAVAITLLEQRATSQLLAEALENLQTLSGLLPICSHCKSVRNDEGYWEQVEVYVNEHTGAQFSHGICPACMKTHYPQYAD